MLFHSYAFICVFMPIVLLGLIAVRRYAPGGAAVAFLACASLAFYAFWSVPYTALLIASIAFNYGMGRIIAGRRASERPARHLLIAAIVINLLGLSYFKYTNFFIENVNALASTAIPRLSLILPLGISYFTFYQVTYLVDVYNGDAAPHRPGHYVLFASFFPCVTAGPIVGQKEMMPQYTAMGGPAYKSGDLAVGLTVFAVGLAKKVLLADSIAPFANSLFDGASAGAAVGVADAWLGSVAYTLQLYFDFSGYSDMALGAACMLGFRLPLNFNSPLKATSIIDFWQRWHITMTRFFTNYVYSPIAVTLMRTAMRRRFGAPARFALVVLLPVVLTFVLAGFWHGAGWTFILFGVVHGVALAVNHAWREIRLPAPPKALSWALTMVVVVGALVLFRADRLDTALSILRAMAGAPAGAPAKQALVGVGDALPWIAALGVVALAFPNLQQLMRRHSPTCDEIDERAASRITWRPGALWAVAAAVTMAIALLSITSASDFLYYKF